MKRTLFFILLLVTVNLVVAQTANFISSGTLYFERKINMYSQSAEQPPMVELFKQMNFQFKRELFTLSFDSDRTLYQPGQQLPENGPFPKISFDDNVVLSQLAQHSRLSRKKLFEKTYFISDSMVKSTWKLTDEKRQIAGFDCRRANAIFFDSIYVIAYFTEEITTRGGPESFNGLPGMILGLVIPEQHVTWFATKIAPQTDLAKAKLFEGKKIMAGDQFKTVLTTQRVTNGGGLWDWDYRFGFF